MNGKPPPRRKGLLWLGLLIATAFGLDRLRAARRKPAPGKEPEAPAPAPTPPGLARGVPARPGPPAPIRFPPLPLLIIGVAGLIGMATIWRIAPRAAAGGWLTALIFWSGATVGSVVALLIYGLTGGRWAERFAAFFMPAAAGSLVNALLFAPVLIDLSLFYPWPSAPPSVPPDVARLYLDPPFFIARTASVWCFWIALGFLLPRLTGSLAVLVAAIGLAIHALVIGLVGIDWILSLEPPFVSTSFGATLAVTQLAAAFAFALVVSPGRQEDTGMEDLAGLLLAALLGLAYLNFIAVLVVWYGDLPHKVSWFVQRMASPWWTIGVLTFFLGSVVPIFSLFLRRVRASRAWLRVVGAVALAGIALYDAYLIAPAFGPDSLGAAIVAAIAIGGLLMAFIGTRFAQAGWRIWSANHER
jgi:hypothetical protein